MASRHTLFGVFYRIGFTPWDGHTLGQSLRDLVEGTDDTSALAPGSALDVGCGTGDSSIYLAQHGWKVTGVDFVPKALDKARAVAIRLGDGVILGADTVVVVGGDVLGKPEDAEAARGMLRRLRAREHEVLTGVAVSA